MELGRNSETNIPILSNQLSLDIQKRKEETCDSNICNVKIKPR